jgi:KRAB domain-containing zinc finger protein
VPGKYRCEQCDRRFAGTTQLKSHLRIHTGIRPHACTECSMKFKQKGQLQVHHQRKHTLERPYACELCDKRTSTKAEMKHHRVTHTFVKEHACDVGGCGKKFTQKWNMLAHKSTVHKKVPGKYRCEQCGRAHATPDKLNMHRRTHTGERPFACTECAAKFTQKSILQNHYLAVHMLDRPFACAHCGKTFASNTLCRGHVRSAHK